MRPLRRSSGGLRKLIGLLLLACARTPAEHYARALDVEVPLAKAMDGCGTLPAGDADDCKTAALEIREEEGQCGTLEDPLWKDECLFLEGERLRKEGRLEEAFALCESTRFGRECSWHILRDEAHNVHDRSFPEVEAYYKGLPYGKRVPDGEALFWESWFTHRRFLGNKVDRRDCEVLSQPRHCFEGADRTFDETCLMQNRRVFCEKMASGEPLFTLEDGTSAFYVDSYSQGRAEVLCRGH